MATTSKTTVSLKNIEGKALGDTLIPEETMISIPLTLAESLISKFNEIDEFTYVDPYNTRFTCKTSKLDHFEYELGRLESIVDAHNQGV